MTLSDSACASRIVKLNTCQREFVFFFIYVFLVFWVIRYFGFINPIKASRNISLYLIFLVSRVVMCLYAQCSSELHFCWMEKNLQVLRYFLLQVLSMQFCMGHIWSICCFLLLSTNLQNTYWKYFPTFSTSTCEIWKLCSGITGSI